MGIETRTKIRLWVRNIPRVRGQPPAPQAGASRFARPSFAKTPLREHNKFIYPEFGDLPEFVPIMDRDS
jgi:hypothetical protein